MTSYKVYSIDSSGESGETTLSAESFGGAENEFRIIKGHAPSIRQIEHLDEDAPPLNAGLRGIEELKVLIETFEAEANDGGISDTCQREKLMGAVSEILVGSDCPTYGDPQHVRDEFHEKIKPYMTK